MSYFSRDKSMVDIEVSKHLLLEHNCKNCFHYLSSSELCDYDKFNARAEDKSFVYYKTLPEIRICSKWRDRYNGL